MEGVRDTLFALVTRVANGARSAEDTVRKFQSLRFFRIEADATTHVVSARAPCEVQRGRVWSCGGQRAEDAGCVDVAPCSATNCPLK